MPLSSDEQGARWAELLVSPVVPSERAVLSLPQCWQIHPWATQKGTESQVLTHPWRKDTRVCCRACEAAPPPLPVAMSPGAPRGQPQCGQGPVASSLSVPEVPLAAPWDKGSEPKLQGPPASTVLQGRQRPPFLWGAVLVRSPQAHLTTSFPRGYGGGQTSQAGSRLIF